MMLRRIGILWIAAISVLLIVTATANASSWGGNQGSGPGSAPGGGGGGGAVYKVNSVVGPGASPQKTIGVIPGQTYLLEKYLF